MPHFGYDHMKTFGPLWAGAKWTNSKQSSWKCLCGRGVGGGMKTSLRLEMNVHMTSQCSNSRHLPEVGRFGHMQKTAHQHTHTATYKTRNNMLAPHYDGHTTGKAGATLEHGKNPVPGPALGKKPSFFRYFLESVQTFIEVLLLQSRA